jgi:hypothetical protein
MPPSTGPSTGANWVGTLTAVITRPIRSRPAARTRMVCASGGIMPPPRPWHTRNMTRLHSDQATPHSIEAARNSPSASSHIRRAPNRSTAQPVTGSTTAMASR